MEELGELTRAVVRNRGDDEEELGDMLFGLIALSMSEDIDLQVALQRAIDKHKAPGSRQE
jgi:NTP pyrophosphatase (non-canonical NTP hydrolase)